MPVVDSQTVILASQLHPDRALPQQGRTTSRQIFFGHIRVYLGVSCIFCLVISAVEPGYFL